MRRITRPYGRTWFRGVQLDNRTKSALLWAEGRYVGVAPKVRRPWTLAQGSYNAGGVVNSAGTHDGGGAVDIGAASLSDKQVRASVKWLRKAGFAAWFRPAAPGVWGPHIHAILLGHRTASPGARQQMDAYRNHRDGLAGNRIDPAWRPKRPRRWSHLKNRPVVGR